MSSNELRKKFLAFFASKGHEIVPSSPVYPLDDPTLLFTNAGMNQFKDVFLGSSKRPYTRAVSAQKCIRAGGKHNDLENVGHTTRHLTFFEMLGNFSFGDYFKKEAIAFAWEVSLDLFKLDPTKIWASVFQEDEESYRLWQKFLPKERIVKMGEKDNFWSMGEVGPCGPCSELLFDRGASFGPASSPLHDPEGERFFEFWNLVFMQQEKKEDGSLVPLPNKSIDTGVGLERVVSLQMGLTSIFQTDILRELISSIERLSQQKYSLEDKKLSPAFHVIADHIRSLSFAIADGLIPSNTDRGYVLRKILRRAVRYGKQLGFTEPFLGKVSDTLVNIMGDDYPELSSSHAKIREVLHKEEEAFFRVLRRGGNLMADIIAAAKKKKVIPGEAAFKLKDTYGFPIEEITLMAKDHQLTVDLKTYYRLEEEAKERSRDAKVEAHQHFSKNLFTDFASQHSSCSFVGYEEEKSEATIIGIVKEDTFVDELSEKEEGVILLDQTPFYAEMGGQVGDSGTISHGDNSFHVETTRSPYEGVISHMGKQEKGSLRVGEKVSAQINHRKRSAIQRNHTATHLLHWALRKLFGSHIKQSGSFVGPERLRFDFAHHKPLSFHELRQLEDMINQVVWDCHPVQSYHLPYKDVMTREDIQQFFGDKYGEVVRVIDIDFSKELCGGTHVPNTGKIGLFRIVKESSIAAGVRRIEAVTASYAVEAIRKEEDLLSAVSAKLQTPTPKVMQKVDQLLSSLAEKDELIAKNEREKISALCDELLQTAQNGPDFRWICQEVSIDKSHLMDLANTLLSQMEPGLVILGSKNEQSCQIVVRLSSSLPFDAKQLIQEIAPLIKGGGGGKKEMAQAGGKAPESLSSALKKLQSLLSA